MNAADPNRRGHIRLACGALTLITLAVYANSFQSGFVLDNRSMILEDSRIRSVTAGNIDLILHRSYWWLRSGGGLYRPLTTLSYMLNYAILGNADHPAGYHWLNLLLHAANVLLAFALCLRLLRDVRLSFLAAGVWAVHPVLTESVTNIIGRADLLAGAATLAGLLLYLRSAESVGSRRAGWLAGLAFVTAIGAFSKESAVMIMAIIVLYEATWWNRRRLPALLSACLAMAPGLLALLWMRTRALAQSPPMVLPFVDNPIVGAGFWTGRLTAIKVLIRYLGVLAWPAHLSPDYSYNQIPLVSGSAADWLACIVVLALAGAIGFLYFRNKVVFFAAGFAFLALLPASNLLFPVGTIMAERLLYLPAIGFAICLVAGLFAVLKARAVAAAAGLAIVAALGACTVARNNDWRNDLTLWSAAVRMSPLSFKTHYGLAEAMRREANDLGGATADREIEEDGRSLAILDSLPDKWNVPGLYISTASEYMAQGGRFLRRDEVSRAVATLESRKRFRKAQELLRRGITTAEAQVRTPGMSKEASEAWLMLSEIDQQLGEMEDALRAAQQAQVLDPLRGRLYIRVHDVLMATAKRDQAIAALLGGYVVTMDPQLQRRAVQDYADRQDEMKCAISYTAAAPAIDFSCPVVRARVCGMSGDTIMMAEKAGPQTAARVKNDLRNKYGCPVA